METSAFIELPVVTAWFLLISQSFFIYGQNLPAPRLYNTSISLGGKAPSNGDCFKQFPQLQQRFNWEQLEYFCQKWRAHNDLIFSNSSNTTETRIPSPFTVSQKRYLDSLKIDINATNNDKFPMAVRKEIRSMGEIERVSFFLTVAKLKQEKIDGVSKYDLIVMLRHPALAPGAQVGAAFMGWHREYLMNFERALQLINPYVFLPYWDTTIDEALPNPTASILWTTPFFGDGRGAVKTGPFASWSFEGNANRSDSLPLVRNVGGGGKLMSGADATFLRSRTSYREYAACVDLKFEQMIRGVHEWVGGTMGNLYYSPQDPVFFMFHAYVDSLWEDWRRSQSYTERVFGYPTDKDACTKFHFAKSPMSPFEPKINSDGLSDVYTRLFYIYQLRPTCSAARNSCLSKYLTCDTKRNHCLSMIAPGGRCAGLEQFNPCYQSQCIKGTCVEKEANKIKKTESKEPIKQKR